MIMMGRSAPPQLSRAIDLCTQPEETSSSSREHTDGRSAASSLGLLFGRGHDWHWYYTSLYEVDKSSSQTID